MQTILAGLIETQDRVDALMAQLRDRGIAMGDMQAFYLTPPGQRAQLPAGGDQYADADAQDASKGQAKGVAVGAAAGLVAGAVVSTVVPPLAPIIIAGVTGVGALAGSVAGAVSSGKSQEESAQSEDAAPQAREGGLMIAVHVTPQTEATVLEVMQSAQVSDIERTTGQWRDGHWVDFDPMRPTQKADV